GCRANESLPDTMWSIMSISAKRRTRSEVTDRRSDRNILCRRTTFLLQRDSLRRKICRDLSELTPNTDRDHPPPRRLRRTGKSETEGRISDSNLRHGTWYC